MTDDNERDAEGRHPGAPAWSGDLAGASTAALESHESGLRSHIGNLSVKYEAQKPAGRQWRPRTDAELRDAGLNRWVSRLVDVANERSKREGAQ